MIIDLHVHGKVSTPLPFDPALFSAAVEEGRRGGLDAIALTEHSGAVGFAESYDFLTSHYPLMGDSFDVGGFKVFYGVEVSTAEHYDVVFIGTPGEVLRFRDTVESSIPAGVRHLGIDALFELDIPEDFLVILAHPFRDHDGMPHFSSHITDRLDAVEMNARDVCKKGADITERKVCDLAAALGLPITAGSDAHVYPQVSTAKNVIHGEPGSVVRIKEEIAEGRCRVLFSDDLEERVRLAGVKKAEILEEWRCG